MTKKFKILSPLLLLASLVIAGCGQESDHPIKVGTNIWPGYEPGHLANDLGYFDGSGIKLIQFQSATESIHAFRNGVVDVAAVTLDEAFLLAQDGIDIKIILVADISDGGDVIVARPEYPSMQDLKGKTIAVENNALGAYVLARALEINGMTPSDVKIHPITVDQSEITYEEKQADAVVTFEPFRSFLIAKGAVEVFNSRQMPNEIVDVVVTRSENIDKMSDNLDKLVDGWLRAVEYINDNPDKAGEILGKRLGMSPEDALRSFDGLSIPGAKDNSKLLSNNGDGSLANSAERLMNVLVEKNLLNNRIETKGMLYSKFVEN